MEEEKQGLWIYALRDTRVTTRDEHDNQSIADAYFRPGGKNKKPSGRILTSRAA